MQIRMLVAALAAAVMTCEPAAAQKVSELPAAATLTGAEKVPVVQGGQTRAATVDAIRAGAGSGGNAATATKLATPRTLAITGDLAWTSPAFDGSANASAMSTLATSGVTAGSCTACNLTIDAKGRVTAQTSGSAGSTITYTEGTFTPALAFGGTAYTDYASRTGRYTRVGRLVTVEIALQIGAKGTATGNATITGLPFAATSAGVTGVSFADASGFSIAGQVSTSVAAGASAVTLYVSGNGTLATLNDTQITNYAVLYVTLTYSI